MMKRITMPGMMSGRSRRALEPPGSELEDVGDGEGTMLEVFTGAI